MEVLYVLPYVSYLISGLLSSFQGAGLTVDISGAGPAVVVSPVCLHVCAMIKAIVLYRSRSPRHDDLDLPSGLPCLPNRLRLLLRSALV